MSLTFWGSVNTGNVTFDGNVLSLIQTGTVGSYNTYEADISAYAGQTGQLLFTAVPNQFLFLDNLQFSSMAVPEPTTLALTALGGAFLCLRRRKNQTA